MYQNKKFFIFDGFLRRSDSGKARSLLSEVLKRDFS